MVFRVLTTPSPGYQVDSEQLDKPERFAVPGHGDKKYDFGKIWSFAYKVKDSSTLVVRGLYIVSVCVFWPCVVCIRNAYVPFHLVAHDSG